ncbi:MAG: ATP-binding protein [Marmoricola sp.]
MSDVEGASTRSGPARALLDAVTAISSDLDLHSVLTRVIDSTTELTGAHHGALGVIGGGDEGVVEFITTGLDRHTQELIGEQPTGRGVLWLLKDEPETKVSFLRVPVRIRGTVFGNLYLTRKAGDAPFTDEDETVVQALATAAGLVIDNARAYGLSERRRQWLEAAAELAELLQPPIDLTRALQQIATSARSVSGAAAAAVISLPTDRAPGVEGMDGPDAYLSPGLLQALTETMSNRGRAIDPVEIRLDEHVAVVITLRAHLADRGALVAVYDGGYRSDDIEERELLASFADQAALALDRTQALLDREELAVISDRGRIARDLHDLVIQRLFATGLQLQAIQSAAVRPEVSAGIGKTVDDLDLTIRDIRGTIFELQSRASDSLRADVRALVREYVPILGFTPAVRTSGPLDTAVTVVVRDHLLAVLREALSNLARHALADQAEVEVQLDRGELRLSVIDDGTGLPQVIHESGLRNARRRAAGLGGTFELTSREPHGTSLVWRVPLS